MSIPPDALPFPVRPRRPTPPQSNPESSDIPPSPGLPSMSPLNVPSSSSDLSKIPPTSVLTMLPLVTESNTASFSQVATTTTSFVDSISSFATNTDALKQQIASSAQTSAGQFIANIQTVCIGDGLDSSSVGILSSLIIPTAVGLVIWVRGIGPVTFRRLMILLVTLLVALWNYSSALSSGVRASRVVCSARRAQRGRRRRANPALAASSLAPTSFVAPSMYYKLRAVRVSGGRFVDSGIGQLPSIPESHNSRISGSRFLELNRSFSAYGRLSISSPEKSGQFRPSSSVAPEENFRMSIPDPRRFGPNYAIDDSMIDEVHEFGVMPRQYDQHEDHVDMEWVDLGDQSLHRMESEPNGQSVSGPSTFRRRPKKDETISSVRRETFPLRSDSTPIVQPPHLRLQPVQPFVRPLDGLNFDDLGQVYADITQWRSKLKAINTAIAEAQNDGYNDIADGTRIKGWLMVGRGLRHIPGIQLIEGRAKEDIRWDVLQNERNPLDVLVFWAILVIVVVLLAAGPVTAVSGLSLATAPDVGHYLSFLDPLNSADLIPAGLATVFAPAVAASSFTSCAIYLVYWTTNVYGTISISGGRLFVFKVTFYILASVATLWLIAVGALLYSFQAFNLHDEVAKSVASGSIYMAILALAIIFTVAVIFPALLLLQPFRLWNVLRDERQAVTPRQRFRAHRYLIGYVYGRTTSQTGGLLQIWLIKRLGTLLSLQPILLGLIFLSREFWVEGGVLAGAGVLVIVFVEAYTAWKMRLPGRRSLSPITRNSLKIFESAARDTSRHVIDSDASTSNGSSLGRNLRLRGSMASVLEMMSVTLAVMPSNTNHRGPIPLQTETLDDLTATERAARTHPDAPPHLPPLAFIDHAEDMAGILYAPELIAPPPIIWLPNDSAGVARSEALDLQRYHDLTVTLDVRAKEDVNPQRSFASQG
ncbi:hypothetical protein C0993_002037 [Termitomyces sp. T159_Od127]|nr:hypothetical protein C0993_002037 [Termitomyces sp. T159_Od127]